MPILVIDPFHGAAGDMITGAFLDLGVAQEPVIRAMASVVASPEIKMVTRCGIRATKILTHAGPAHRNLEEVFTIVESADASPEVIVMAKRVFCRIARAEESVHGKMTHFHEVGADDAIADVIGACTALSLLHPEGVSILPVSLGSGMVTMAHGSYPVPAPATAAICMGSLLITQLGGGDGELCTPTGAALLAEFCPGRRSVPSGKMIKIGYGAGDRDPDNAPNVLRMYLLEDDALDHDIVDILETNVDDTGGEILGYLMERLMREGARDVSAAPLIMKKGRPGHLVRAVVRPEDAERLASVMAEELGTLGIRCIPSVHRFIADRSFRDIRVVIRGVEGTFPVKFGFRGDLCYTLKVEYEKAREFAEKHHIPVRTVMQTVEEEAWKTLEQ